MRGRDRADRELAGALRSLPVPEHADDFFDRLRNRLDAESLEFSAAPSKVTRLSDVRRDPERRSRPRLRRLLTMATAPAAAVACFALVVGGAVVARQIGEPEDGGPGADLRAGVLGRRSLPRTLSSVAPYAPAKTGVQVAFTMRGGDGRGNVASTSVYEATVSPAGDYHIRRDTPFVEISHSAKEARRLTYVQKAAGDVFEDQGGLYNGPPESEVSTPDLQLSRDLGAAVKAIAAEHPEQVVETKWGGRPALQLVRSLDQPSSFHVDEIDYVVDRETGFPLSVVQRYQGTFVRDMVVSAIKDVPLDPAVFGLTARAATAPTQTDHGQRDVTLAEVATLTKRPPLAPAWAPKGYQLTRVTLATELPARDGHTNPPSHQVVALLFRRGYDSFAVTTRLAKPFVDRGQNTWGDPLLQGTPLPDLTDATSLRSGALAGTQAQVGIYPLVWPHLWAQTDDLVITVAGDLTRAELVRIAESLSAYDGG